MIKYKSITSQEKAKYLLLLSLFLQFYQGSVLNEHTTGIVFFVLRKYDFSP